jgi:Nucleotidyl transferase AbiEii toxin, Type IV TA system
MDGWAAAGADLAVVNRVDPRLDVLPPAQRRFWPELVDTPHDFVLYGGTALSLRLGGRQSEDFDFFTNTAIDAHSLAGSLPFLRGAELIQAAPSTATFLLDRGSPIKVSFFGGLRLGRVDEPGMCADTEVRIASLLDLAAQKVRVVQVRAERKDYLDLAVLLDHGITLSRALGSAAALYAAFAPLTTLKALSYFEDGDLPELPQATRVRLAAAAAAVRDVESVSAISTRLSD